MKGKIPIICYFFGYGFWLWYKEMKLKEKGDKK
jgi:hypothetical protein